jgi:glycosyltransferase involved in cell wall biosynthesis
MTPGNNSPRIAMVIPSFEPMPMGGSELQAKKLSLELKKLNVNVFVVTQGEQELPKIETIEGLVVYRFLTILQRAKRNRHKVTITSPQQESKPKFDYTGIGGRQLLYAQITFGWRFKLDNLLQFLGLLCLLFKLRHKFDIIQINTVLYYAVIVGLIGKILNKKVIIKDSTMDGVQQMLGAPFPNVARRFIIRNCHFVAMTNAINNSLLSLGVLKHNITKIPNGITILDIPKRVYGSGKRCLFVGNLYQQPAKGIDILLKAWCRVFLQFPDAQLTIIGAGDIQAYYEYIVGLGIGKSVSLLGKVTPADHYIKNDIFILPSRREGMSNALMEAMMYAMPVIASRISGSEDLIDEHKNGILVEPNNVVALVDAICEMMNMNNLSEWGQYSRNIVTNKCCFKKVASKYLNLYLSLR